LAINAGGRWIPEIGDDVMTHSHGQMKVGRGPQVLEFANRFEPEIWLDGRSDGEWPLIPFSAGPATCPGRNVVLLTTSAAISQIVTQYELDLDPTTSALLSDLLPPTFDHTSPRIGFWRRQRMTSRPEEVGDLRFATIVVNALDMDRATAFWAETLGYRAPGKIDPDDRFAKVVDPSGTGPSVLIQCAEEIPSGPTPVHIDLYSRERDRHVDLLKLGATRVDESLHHCQ
jgi:hypothetical protein